MRRSLPVLLCVLTAGACHASSVLWQIGTPDGSYSEFAIAGHFSDYSARFPHDVTYQIGRSKPAADWPYIQPGPGDPWAGLHPHPFRIDFRLASVPEYACRLVVDLVDSRHDTHQDLLIDINGRRQYRFPTESGTSEASLTDPGAGRHSTISVPFPASWLRQGDNRITLTVLGDCWILYDDVSLETGPDFATAPVVADPIAVERNGKIALSLVNTGQEGDVELQAPASRKLHLQPGANAFSLGPLPSGATSLALVAGGTRTTVQVQKPEVLWRIGSKDGGYDEFAIAGHYPDYRATFPHDVTFRVGRSDPKRDWPYIQPGPDDVWAGLRAHPFRIDFALPEAPAHSLRLNVDLVDTQPRGGPVLQVAINGRASYPLQLPHGASDDSLTNPKAGHPYSVEVPIAASLLHAGDNQIVLTITSGSWMTYDDVSLEAGVGRPDGPVPDGISVVATPLFRRVDGQLRQVVRLKVRNSGVQGEVEVRLDGGVQARRNMTLEPGENTLDFLVSPIVRPTALVATIHAPGSDATARFLAEPQRHWRVYVGASTHTDIGYTDFQERVFQRHDENTARALAACAASPSFKWNLEVGFQAELFRRHDPVAYRQLMARVKQGRIGLGGLYLNMLTGLCSGEELTRAVTFVQDLARAAGAPCDAANLTDVPTAVGTLPMILSESGVHYFANGANDQIPFRFGGRAMDQEPYWWVGLDGTRVLAITTHAYAQAGAIGLLDDVATVEQRLPGWLRQIGHDGYPCDAAYVYGAFGDNQPMSPKYAAVAAAWNKKWAYPKIIIACEDEFFRYVEAHAADKLPVVRGDMGVVWENGAASSARQTAMVRLAKARLEAGERWHSLATALGAERVFPFTDVRAAWDNVLLFDEHTWGASGSVTDPDSEQTRHQWAVKSSFADHAMSEADALLGSGLHATAQASPGAHLVTVFNEQSWPRDIVASVPANDSVVDSAGKALLSQQEPGGTVFLARQVPPLGWRTYRVEASAKRASTPNLLSPGPDEWSWETPDFRLRIDPKTGALASLYDKKLRLEWAANTGGYGLDQLVYALGEPGSLTPASLHTHTSAAVHLVQNGPLRAVLLISREGPKAPPVDTYLILGPGRRLEFLNVMHKKATLAREAAYFAFPFRLAATGHRSAYVELPYGAMQIEKDSAPGGFRDWYTTNSFAALTDGRHTAYLATPHAPLLMFNDIYRGQYHAHVAPLNGCVFVNVANNYWTTNYKASQGGDLVFSFSLKLDAGGFDPLAATKFGWDALSTMVSPTAGGEASLWHDELGVSRPGGSAATPEGSELRLSGGTAVVGGLTWRDGRLIVRLYNPSYAASSTSISLPGRKLMDAWLADLVGKPGKRLSMLAGDREVRVEVPARGLTTVALTAAP